MSNMQAATQKVKENQESGKNVLPKRNKINLQILTLQKGTDSIPKREFKITVIKVLTEVKKTIHEQREKFNKEKILKSTKQKS